MNESALVPFLEGIYSLDLDDQSWLVQALTALKMLCGPRHSYLGYFYDASDVRAFTPWNVCAVDLPPEVDVTFRAAHVNVGPELLGATLSSLRVGSVRRAAMPLVAPLFAARELVGWGDIFIINGLDPSGIGCLLTIGTREAEFSPSAAEETVYTRIAHHVATAFRCRRRLGLSTPPRATVRSSPAAEAVLDAKGRFLHAEGEAKTKAARERIRAAARSIIGVRNGSRRAGRNALDVWHPLVSARWTLVDSFQENGQRYVIAHENQTHAALAALTDREREVVWQATLGLSNKEIAYALGISDSTVRVLMARAAERMGVRTRAELLSHPSVSDLRQRNGAGTKPSLS